VITIRPIQTLEEFTAAEDLQRVVWRITDGVEVVPLNILKPMSKYGGIILGAFDGERLVGCVFGFLARLPTGELYHWSHINASHPDYRGQDIGEKLKWAQREGILAQGLTLMRWTFDPLEGPNGSLNIGKLGATVQEYERNVYGRMDDGLNVGLPSDRFIADWRLDSPRVLARLKEGRPHLTLADVAAHAPFALESESADPALGLRRPLEPVLDLDSEQVLVEFPGNMQELRKLAVALGRDWRERTCQAFEHYFERGYRAEEFISEPGEGGRRNFYLLVRRPSP
jgi:predicted GNAT superfamily acetyltransferase